MDLNVEISSVLRERKNWRDRFLLIDQSQEGADAVGVIHFFKR